MDLVQQHVKPKGISLNLILQWVNLVFIISAWYSYYLNGPNEYVNLQTVIWGSVLAAEVFFFLLIEKRRKDPFIVILCLQIVFYFVLRIFTLSLYHFSVVFLRYPFTPEKLNYAIIYIIVANLAIFAGLYLNKLKPVTNTANVTDDKPTKPLTIFWILIFTYVMSFPSLAGLGVFATLFGLLTSIFISIVTIVFMIITYITLFYDKLTKRIRLTLIIGVILYVLLATATGSRSGIVTISYLVIFAALAIRGSVYIKRSLLIVAVFLIPVLILLFTVATYLRPRLENRAALSKETVDLIKEFDLQETFKDNNELILAPIFDRIGFLDYGAEIISNGTKYSGIFNFSYYSKSIIDNVLTPGFDVFDTALTANALTFVYNDMGPPLKSREKDSYQSDEFTLYGEAYVLMGKWFSIIPIFLMAFAFKRLYVTTTDKYSFRLYVKRGFLLYIFYSTINSFGIDWILFGLVGLIITYHLFKRFFKFDIGISETETAIQK